MLYLDSVDFSLVDTIQSAVHHAQQMAEGKDVAVTFFIEVVVPSIVVGDPARLKQIFTPILSNAVRFTEHGTVALTARVFEESVHVVRIEFIVADTGIGLSREQLVSIFKDSMKSSEGLDTHPEELDLSLTDVKKLVDLHGGTIQIDSMPGKGSIFTIQIPFGKSEKTVLNEASFPITTPLNPLNGIRILIVEDDELNQEVAMRTLKQWNIEVDIAESGATALSKLEKSAFDLILMDLQMPEMDGFETTRRIRSQFSPPLSQIPIIAVTAFVSDEAEARSFEAGMNDYLPKPFEPAVLRAKIARLLNLESAPPSASVSAAVPQDIPSIDRITSLTYIESISNGDQTFILKMVEIYLEQTELFLQQLQNAYEEQNWETVRHITHKIKPSLRMIGLADIGSMVNTIEQCTEEMKNLDQLPALIPQVEHACRQSIIELQRDWERLRKLKPRG
jgi:CheY-like chemotaxis protein/HPt (histidine-containing phosphotransfer) domain-containing protein